MDKMWYIIALVAVFAYGFGAEGATYARCHIKGHSDTHGDICFREDEAGLFAHIHVWHHEDHEDHAGDHDDHHEDGMPIRVHKSAAARRGEGLDCLTIGGVSEGGNLGSFSPNERGAVTGVVRVGLSLSGLNSIVGRAVSVETEDGKRCCVIKRCSEATFARMGEMMEEENEMNHNH